jgi:hypothetical protein
MGRRNSKKVQVREIALAVEAMDNEGCMIYAPLNLTEAVEETTIEKANYPIVLASSPTAFDPMSVLRDDVLYRNKSDQKPRCARCNRGVQKNGFFYKWRGHIFGPECVAHLRAVEALMPNSATDDIIHVVKHAYIVQARVKTVAGMKRKGLIKDKSATVVDNFDQPLSDAAQREMEQMLLAMGA